MIDKPNSRATMKRKRDGKKEEKIIEMENNVKSARGVALPVVGGIAARALWSAMVKSDANLKTENIF